MPVIVLAGLVVWLWPTDLAPGHAVVPARAVFDSAQIRRAHDYRGTQYLLVVIALLLPPLVAGLLAWRRGDRLALGRRSWVQVLTAAFLVALASLAAIVPVLFIDYHRAHECGLDLRSPLTWATGTLITLGTTAALVAVVYLAAWAIARRRRRPWLAVGLVAWGAVAVAFTLQPVVWDPVMLATSRLPPDGRGEAIVVQLERQMHVHPRSVVVADAGSRTVEENALTDGVGPTTRVVVYDTALSGLSTRQLRALIAHEFGHVQRLHTLKGVLWFGVLALPALWLIWRLLDPIARRRHTDGLVDPRSTALVLAGVLTAATLLTPVENLISRRIEAEADWAGLRATHDGPGMEALQRRLAIRDLTDPDPPAWAVWIEFDHPPVMDRIAIARDYSKRASK